jgi:hypothetical protein
VLNQFLDADSSSAGQEILSFNTLCINIYKSSLPLYSVLCQLNPVSGEMQNIPILNFNFIHFQDVLIYHIHNVIMASVGHTCSMPTE